METSTRPRPPAEDVRRPGPHLRGLTVLALLGLYLAGLAHWTWFFYRVSLLFQQGPAPPLALEVYDWPKEVAHARVLRDALREGRIPYHVDDPARVSVNLRDGRFLGLPETILTPDALLLAL